MVARKKPALTLLFSPPRASCPSLLLRFAHRSVKQAHRAVCAFFPGNARRRAALPSSLGHGHGTHTTFFFLLMSGEIPEEREKGDTAVGNRRETLFVGEGMCRHSLEEEEGLARARRLRCPSIKKSWTWRLRTRLWRNTPDSESDSLTIDLDDGEAWGCPKDAAPRKRTQSVAGFHVPRTVEA